MSNTENKHPEQDPAEGSSEIIDRDLARQGGKQTADVTKNGKTAVEPGSEAAEPSSE